MTRPCVGGARYRPDMREAVWGEDAMGCPDRGIAGGFIAALQRFFAADPAAGGSSRSWVMAALTGYGLKSVADRRDACSRLAPLFEPAGAPPQGPARLDDSLDTLPGVGEKVLERLASLQL